MGKEKIEPTSKGKYGIFNLIRLQQWKAGILAEILRIIQRKKDGKTVNGWVALRFIDDFFEFGKLMKDYKEIGKEFKDLDSSERIELNKVFEESLDIPNDKLEEFAEKTNKISSDLADYIMYLSDLKL
jgi:hypothetical protein